MMAQEVKYPDVEVQLVGLNGNAYAIIGRCVQMPLHERGRRLAFIPGSGILN